MGDGPRSATSPDSRLVLHELVVRQEDGDYIVGRVSSGVFIAVPHIGVRIIELIGYGLSLGEVRERINLAEHVEVDVCAFADDLLDCGFVATLDEAPTGAAHQRPGHLPWLRPEHVRWAFSRPAAVVWLITVAAAVTTLVRQPGLLPDHDDFFWLPGTSLALIAATAIACLTITAHELAHLAAARSLGIPARISISTRLYYLVAQTDVSGTWALPRRCRFRVYLAGIALDLLVAAAAILLIGHARLPDSIVSPLRAVVLTLTLSIAWQFEIYLRTDLYFVLLDLLKCRNLHADAWQYLRGVWARIRRDRGTPSVSTLSTWEARRIRWYAWFMAGGTAIALGAFAGYTVPILVRLWRQAAETAWHGATTAAPIPFLDGTATLLHQALLITVFIIAFRRRRSARTDRMIITHT